MVQLVARLALISRRRMRLDTMYARNPISMDKSAIRFYTFAFTTFGGDHFRSPHGLDLDVMLRLEIDGRMES